ncbi:MAG TPA: hypothetical protein VLF21_02335 [Candidatus Saccharimonadales bacterium]|nr:hypothetical protein [Candidatus Saccharimonadales bacterium]
MITTLTAILLGWRGAHIYAVRAQWIRFGGCLLLILEVLAYSVRMNYYWQPFVAAWALASLWSLRPRPALEAKLAAALERLKVPGDRVFLSVEETKYKPVLRSTRNAYIIWRSLSSSQRKVEMLVHAPGDMGRDQPEKWQYRLEGRVIEVRLRSNGLMQLEVLKEENGLAG